MDSSITSGSQVSYDPKGFQLKKPVLFFSNVTIEDHVDNRQDVCLEEDLIYWRFNGSSELFSDVGD